METKKYEHQRIERKIPLFFMFGLNIAILLTIVAFEWKTQKTDLTVCTFGPTGSIFEHEDYVPPLAKKIPIPTRQEFKPTDTEVTTKDTPVEEPPIEPPVTGVEGGMEIPDMPPLPIEPTVDAPFRIVEEMPSYPGGWEAFYKFLAKNTKYPKAAQRMAIEGRVHLEFTIERDGSITDLVVVKGMKGGLDEEALRVMGLVSKFNPGKQRGKPVRVRQAISINFQLNK